MVALSWCARLALQAPFTISGTLHFGRLRSFLSGGLLPIGGGTPSTTEVPTMPFPVNNDEHKKSPFESNGLFCV